MSEFVPNPDFEKQLEDAILRALKDKAEDILEAAERNTKHPSIAATLTSSPATVDREGPVVTIRYGRGLGPIFEGGTEARYAKTRTINGEKRTLSKPAHRGRIQPPERALERAVDEELDEPLDLDRYL